LLGENQKSFLNRQQFLCISWLKGIQVEAVNCSMYTLICFQFYEKRIPNFITIVCADFAKCSNKNNSYVHTYVRIKDTFKISKRLRQHAESR
jgi:hypothetical protein